MTVYRAIGIILICLCLGSSFHPLTASPEQDFPVLYQGRYRPAEAYALAWLYETYHASPLRKEDVKALRSLTAAPLSFLWSLNVLGKESFPTLKEFATIPSSSPIEPAFHKKLLELQTQQISSKEIGKLLEQEYPLVQRLKTAGTLFKSLPSRYQEGEWFPVKALAIQIYHPASGTLHPIGNFTLFSDLDFEAIRQAYLSLEQAIIEKSSPEVQKNTQHRFALTLQQAYEPLAGKISQKAHDKQLHYPSLTQLKMERIYVSYPWIPLLLLFYGIGACLLALSYFQLVSIPYSIPLGLITLGALCHTMLLAARCYILERPPVSNMFETITYVPWVAICISLIIPSFRRQPLILLAACLSSTILFIILQMVDMNQSLDQAQAVLDSQFWLTVHVLLVVGSYGVFILGALIAHFYLGLFIVHRKETASMQGLTKFLLQTLYGGTALLLIGTILGGIWAAQSWGRFWDWDPKESWAFISICFYLIGIHAYRFHRIASFGLAMIAVGGWLAISFTWYGVNYILGTGLHSYGFGSGGEYYYYTFVGAECLFLAFAYRIYCKSLLPSTLH